MIWTSRDARYLESMIRFLTGKQPLPASDEGQFWSSDLPPPSSSKDCTAYGIFRTQWTATYGFRRTNSFADHDALRINENANAGFDIVVAANKRLHGLLKGPVAVEGPSLVLGVAQSIHLDK